MDVNQGRVTGFGAISQKMLEKQKDCKQNYSKKS